MLNIDSHFWNKDSRKQSWQRKNNGPVLMKCTFVSLIIIVILSRFLPSTFYSIYYFFELTQNRPYTVAQQSNFWFCSCKSCVEEFESNILPQVICTCACWGHHKNVLFHSFLFLDYRIVVLKRTVEMVSISFLWCRTR